MLSKKSATLLLLQTNKILYYVHTKVILFGFITEYDKILRFIQIAFEHWMSKIYSDRGQILINPIKFESAIQSE